MATATIIQSCREEDDEKKKTKEELLCSSQCWRPVSRIVDTTKDGVDNGTEQIANCDLDNCETFNTNGTGYINFGPQICGGEQSTSTTWSWTNSSQNAINYQQGNGIIWQYEILELTETTFRYSMVMDFTSTGGTYTKMTVKAIH